MQLQAKEAVPSVLWYRVMQPFNQIQIFQVKRNRQTLRVPKLFKRVWMSCWGLSLESNGTLLSFILADNYIYNPQCVTSFSSSRDQRIESGIYYYSTSVYLKSTSPRESLYTSQVNEKKYTNIHSHSHTHTLIIMLILQEDWGYSFQFRHYITLIGLE